MTTSELGNLVQNFRHFRYEVSVRLTNHSYWTSCLRWFMGVKIMFILIETSPGLEIIAGWGNLPNSMVLRSEESLKSEMLSPALTSKYVKNTSVLSINKSEEDSLDRKDSSNLIVIIVINSYSCFLLDNIVCMQNQL